MSLEKKICYFCGNESNSLRKCPSCLEMYCSSHYQTDLHDCPLVPIQNPYSLNNFIENKSESDKEQLPHENNILNEQEVEIDQESENDDDYDEFDVDMDGVFDLEHKYEDPDGYLKPVQYIDPKSPYVKSIKYMKNGTKECYFCGTSVDSTSGGMFIKCRNIEESVFSGMKRGLFGGKIDGFWLCNNPDCSIKWKSKEPVYLTFKDGGKIYKFISKEK